MNKLATAIALTTLISVPTAVYAENNWQEEAKDAWLDGKAETTLLLNSNLNSFDINTDVNEGVVTLTGSVNNDLEKALAQELVSGLDGVKSVENKLTVSEMSADATSETLEAMTDTKITAIVKTRLLLDTNVSGSAIEVTTQEQAVTLAGQVSSDAEHDLAILIASNTNDVTRVIDKLEIVQ